MKGYANKNKTLVGGKYEGGREKSLSLASDNENKTDTGFWSLIQSSRRKKKRTMQNVKILRTFITFRKN